MPPFFIRKNCRYMARRAIGVWVPVHRPRQQELPAGGSRVGARGGIGVWVPAHWPRQQVPPAGRAVG